MLHPIDPTVDYAFKRLFGDPAHADLLSDFLNAILRPDSPIVEVEILNPFNEREFEDGKLTAVDVKAKLADGRRIQIEVQSSVPPSLPERMVYTWADMYQEQLAGGDDFTVLRPVISIWVLRNRLFKDSRSYHHRFRMLDTDGKRCLSDHCTIHVLVLSHFSKPRRLDERASWLYFLKEARHWTALPPALDTPTMRKAMSVLSRISDKKEDYWAYQARQNAIRDQETTRKVTEQQAAKIEELTEDRQLLEEALRELGVNLDDLRQRRKKKPRRR